MTHLDLASTKAPTKAPTKDSAGELASVSVLASEPRSTHCVNASAVSGLTAAAKYGDAATNLVLKTFKMVAPAGSAASEQCRDRAITQPIVSLRTLDVDDAIRRLVVHPDGQTIAMVGSPTQGSRPDQTHTVRWWNWVTGEVKAEFIGHDAPILAIALSADGNYLVSGSADHTVKVWHLATGQAVTLRGHAGPVTAVAISGDGTTVVSAGCNQYVTVNGRVKTTVSDRGLRVWQVSTGQEIARLPAITDAPTLRLSPPGDRLFCFDSRPQVQTIGGAALPLQALPSGRWLQISATWNTVAALVDETVVIRDLATGRDVARLSQQGGDRLQVSALSPTGRWFAGGYQTIAVHPKHGNYLPPQNHLKIWDATTGKMLATLTDLNAGLWQNLKFSADGNRLFSSVGNQIRVWGVN